MIFHIALKDLKIVFRDKKALAVMLLMPALIMFILGSAFGQMFNSGNHVDKFTIGVVNKDNGQYSSYLINNYLRGEMSNMFETYVVSEDKANDMLRKKTAPAVIIIPENFTNDILANKPTKIEVRSQKDDNIRPVVVNSVVGGFAQNVSDVNAASLAVDSVSKDYKTVPPKTLGDMPKVIAIQQEIRSKLGEVGFKDVEATEKHETVSAMQYYSAAMLVMFLLFGANMGSRMIIEEREVMTLGRVVCSKAGKVSLVIGKFFGLMFICLMQAAVLIAFTDLAYGVNWGNSIPLLMVITICSVFASAGFGMFIAAIAKTPKMADGLGQLFIQMFTLLGGGMIPIYVMPSTMKLMAKFTLNWWAFSGFHSLMLGMGALTILPYCGILLLIGLVFMSIGIWRFRV